MASVELAGLACGTIFTKFPNQTQAFYAPDGRAMFVYARDTTTQVQVYSDEALTVTVTQPLLTLNGDLPGYIASGQSIDIVDQASGALIQGEALNASAVGGGGAGDLLAANNLSDLVSASTARTNLGLGSAAVDAASAFDAAGTATTAVATETTRAETAEALLAPKASPALTGTPTVPTASALTNTTQAASTAYADSAVGVEKTRALAAEALLAPIAAPALTGNGSISGSWTATGELVASSALAYGGAQSMSSSASLSGTVSVVLMTTSAITLTLTAPGVSGRVVLVKNLSSGSVTVSPPASWTVNGTTTLTLAAGDSALLWGQTSATDYRILSYYLAAGGGGGSVSSVFTRTGAVVATSGDYTVAQVTGAAPLASPTFTGTPASVTAAVDTNTTEIATTAWVLAQTSATVPVIDGTASVGSGTRFALSNHVHPTDTSRSALASPTFTGTPAAPTATAGTNTTQLATTAFVAASFAPLASPTLTGTPAAPTASAGTTTTQVATTAFVQTAAITPVVQSTASGSTFAILSTSGAAKLTALAAACTISISGTPADCQKLFLRIKDNGTTRALTWTGFVSSGVATLPTTTTVSKTMSMEFVYDSVTSKYVLVASDVIGY